MLWKKMSVIFCYVVNRGLLLGSVLDGHKKSSAHCPVCAQRDCII